MKAIVTNEKQIYICDICGNIGNWDNNWKWFGSYNDQENGLPILYSCSEKCRDGLTEFTLTNLLKLKRNAKHT